MKSAWGGFFLSLFFLSTFGSANAGMLSLGAQYDGWSAVNTALPVTGAEFTAPFSARFKLNDAFGLFGQTEFAATNDTGTSDGSTPSSYSPADLSDSVLGTDIHFENFGLSAMLNLSLNLPTGNQDWETKQMISSIPTEFIDSRYRGRGFGFNAMYGVSIPAGKTSQLGVALGYLFSGSYNTTEIPDLDLGDSIFLGINRVEVFAGQKTSSIRLSTLFFLPTTENGTQSIEEGLNLNASYSFNDPSGFSYEVGGQFFTPAKRAAALGGSLETESHNSLGQRLYAAPSLAFGQWTISGLVKYVTPNDYAESSALYDGGGWLLGLTPTWRAPLNAVSDLKFTAGYDFVIARNAGSVSGGGKADIDYNYWQFGTNYEIKL
ncbi:MAG: hypothetical protein ACREL1_02405 [bacterium]